MKTYRNREAICRIRPWESMVWAHDPRAIHIGSNYSKCFPMGVGRSKIIHHKVFQFEIYHVITYILEFALTSTS